MEKEIWTKKSEINEHDNDEAHRARKRIQLIDEEISDFEKQKNAAEKMATELANDFVARALDVEDLIRNKKEKPNPQRLTESLRVENVSSSPKQSLVSFAA